MATERDVLPEGRILLVGGATVMVLLLAAVIAVAWARGTGGGPAHDEPGIDDVPVRIGPIEARMFTGPRVEVSPAEYGWVDEESGEVRVPIDHAIRWVSQGVRPIGAPPPEAR